MFPKTREQFFLRLKNLVDFGSFLPPGSQPIFRRNEEGRLHSDKMPAYQSSTRITWYRDGKRHGLDGDIFGSMVYYWRGVLIPQHYYIDSSNLDLTNVLLHPNVEVRSVGLEIYGYERMVADRSFIKIHRDSDKEMSLYRFESPGLHEPLVVIQLKNSSPEKDGTYKLYFICVPPNMKTCQQAVAWTFDKEINEYHPSIET